MDILTPIAIAILTPPCAWVVKMILDGERKRRVFNRIQDDPRLRVGRPISRVFDTTSGRDILGPCTVMAIDRGGWTGPGKVTLQEVASGDFLTVTGIEFESFHPFCP